MPTGRSRLYVLAALQSLADLALAIGVITAKEVGLKWFLGMKFMLAAIAAFLIVLIFADYVFNHGDSTEAGSALYRDVVRDAHNQILEARS